LYIYYIILAEVFNPLRDYLNLESQLRNGAEMQDVVDIAYVEELLRF